MSWETVVALSSEFGAHLREKRPELARLHKELAMTRLLLMEKAREQGAGSRVDPRLLVDLVRLLERSEKAAAGGGMDLDRFNTFVYLMIQKVKTERLARHEGEERGAGKPGSDLAPSAKNAGRPRAPSEEERDEP